MVKLDRRLLVDATLIGVVLTLLVAAADGLGVLAPLERWLYDQRAVRCQHWTPPPTNLLVHVDVDDASLDAIGAWPWKRTDVADILDELRLAGPKAVALDVLFSEPQKPEGKVDPDAELAQAIARMGNCVVAASFPFRRQGERPVYSASRDALYADAEQTEEQVVQALRLKGFNEPDLPAKVHEEFQGARREALYQRVR